MMVSEESFGFWWGKKSNHFEIIKIFFNILYINKLSMKLTIKLMDNENICCGKCCVCVLLNSNSVGFCQKNRTHKTNSKQTWAVTKAAAFASWIIAPAWQMFGLHRVSYSHVCKRYQQKTSPSSFSHNLVVLFCLLCLTLNAAHTTCINTSSPLLWSSGLLSWDINSWYLIKF